jgi:uncharacterized protein YukE
VNPGPPEALAGTEVVEGDWRVSEIADIHQLAAEERPGMSLRLSIEDLVASGVAVTGYGEDLALRHVTADGRIDAAHSGWQGQSAVALAAKADMWRQDSRVLMDRLSAHAEVLHDSANRFWGNEQRSIAALDSLY